MNPLYLPLAALFFVLAVAGVFLPLLPTTPFVLLTSWCLVRSSPRLEAKLRSIRPFGAMLEDWERERGLSARTKLVAYLGIAVGVTISLLFGGMPWPLDVVLLATGAFGAWYVGRLPTVAPRERDSLRDPQR